MSSNEDTVSEEFSVALVIILSSSAVIGTIGNGLVILAVATFRKLQNIHNVYVTSLAIADLTVCAILMPFYAVSSNHIPYGCEALGYISLCLLLISMLNFTGIAINRYVLLCFKTETYKKAFTYKTVAFSIVFLWGICGLTTCLPFLGFGEFGYNSKFGACLFIDEDTLTYWFVQAIGHGLIAFPAVGITLYCYVRIALKIRSTSRNVHAQESVSAITVASGAQPTSSQVSPHTSQATLSKYPKRHQLNAATKVTFHIFLLWLCFMTFWMPVIITFTVDYYSKASPYVYRIGYTIACTNSAVNPILYAGMNKEFRKAYIRIFRCKICNK